MGVQAKEVGLVDELGGFNDAINATKTLLDVDSVTIVFGAKKSILSRIKTLYAHEHTSDYTARALTRSLALYMAPPTFRRMYANMTNIPMEISNEVQVMAYADIPVFC